MISQYSAVLSQKWRISRACRRPNRIPVALRTARSLLSDFPRLVARRVATHPRKSRSVLIFQSALATRVRFVRREFSYRRANTFGRTTIFVRLYRSCQCPFCSRHSNDKMIMTRATGKLVHSLVPPDARPKAPSSKYRAGRKRAFQAHSPPKSYPHKIIKQK